MQFPNPFAMLAPRHPDAEGSGGDLSYTVGTDDDLGDGGGGGSGGHYNPEQPRDWHGRWTAGPDGRGGDADLLTPVADGPGSYSDSNGRLVLIIGGMDKGTGNGLDAIADVPAWKASVFAGQPGAWQGFNTAVTGLPEPGDAEAFSYGEIFAAEGGVAVDRKTFASSGIMPATLDALRGRIPGLGGGIAPANLTYGQRAAFYRAYFDDALRSVGGHRALEAAGNPFAASALADTLFRFGASGGTRLLQSAMDKVMPGGVGIDGRMGPGTFGVFREFASDPARRGPLLEALYNVRKSQLSGREEDRNQHFRYLRER
ncbi:MAG: hypothetical protein EPN20_07665 [Magnetospirillum sp.]|nr:MAG: hypothetical protein EPN20_07665 [Magnetospirillum sp.]